MSEDNTIDPKSTSPDDLTKTTSNAPVELKEEELAKASGGAYDAFLKFNETKQSAPTENVSLNFQKVE